MKSVLISALIFCALADAALGFKLTKDAGKSPRARRLGEIETLQEEAQEKAKMDNVKILMTNMKRDNEIKSLESIISEIGEHVDQINDTVNAKTMEFMDTVDRIVNQRNSRSDVYSVKSQQ